MQRIRIALLLAFVAAGPASALEDSAPDPAALAKELPRIPPRSPAEALASFRLEEGFEIQLVAAEPLVIDPIAMAFDEDGRMLVVEMRDYPFEPGKGQSPEQDARSHPGRIRLLEDVDGDLRVDRSTVYADGLSWPTGVLPWKGGAFVTAAPDILYLKDEDGDGVADRREVVFSGFGRQNVQGLLNTPRWGLDNRIWGTSGSNGGDVRGSRGGAPLSLRGRDFRFKPGDRADACGPIEPATGGGQFGMCFDDWGRRFVCSNSNHLRFIAMESRYLDRNPFYAGPTSVVDIAEDGAAAPVFRASSAEPWRLVRTRWRAASAERSRYAATELVPIGFFTSATGIVIYRGSAFPPGCRGNAFIGDVGGNLIHRKVIEPSGTIFRARRPEKLKSSEFLTSTDNWFRPASLAEGPDGALYVCDMYRETIEHPFSIPDSIKQFLDLKSGDDRGRIWRIAPKGFAPTARPALSHANTGDLVKLLASTGSWWRETAQRLLIERGGQEAAGLLSLMSRSGATPLARIHALHALEGLGSLRVEDVERACADADSRVRETAAELAEGLLPRESTGNDPLAAALVRLADDAEIRVRRQVALSLGSVGGESVLAALARIALRDPGDEWIRAAVISSSPTRSGRLLARLLESVGPGERQRAAALEPFVAELASVAGARNDAAEVAIVLRASAGMEGPDRESIRAASVLGLGEGLRRAGASLSALLDSPPAELASAAAAMEPLFSEAARRCASPGTSEAARLEAVRLLGCAKFSLANDALGKLLDARQPQAIQIAALQALSAFPDKTVAALLLERWKSFSPPVRREAAEALFQRVDRVEALLEGLAGGALAPSDLDPERRVSLLKHAVPEIRARAAKLLVADGSSDRKAVVDRYRPALERTGDAGRGKLVFKRVCATCHRLAGEGHLVAPDFNTVRDRSPESLLVHILDPNREVSPSYVVYAAILADGRSATGVIATESGSSITLRRAEGVEETILRSQIDRFESSGLSLMPEGLEKDVSIEEMADLIQAVRTGG